MEWETGDNRLIVFYYFKKNKRKDWKARPIILIVPWIYNNVYDIYIYRYLWEKKMLEAGHVEAMNHNCSHDAVLCEYININEVENDFSFASSKK